MICRSSSSLGHSVHGPELHTRLGFLLHPVEQRRSSHPGVRCAGLRLMSLPTGSTARTNPTPRPNGGSVRLASTSWSPKVSLGRVHRIGTVATGVQTCKSAAGFSSAKLRDYRRKQLQKQATDLQRRTLEGLFRRNDWPRYTCSYGQVFVPVAIVDQDPQKLLYCCSCARMFRPGGGLFNCTVALPDQFAAVVLPVTVTVSCGAPVQRVKFPPAIVPQSTTI